MTGVPAGLDPASVIDIDCDLELCLDRFVPLVGVSVGVVGLLEAFVNGVLTALLRLFTVESFIALDPCLASAGVGGGPIAVGAFGSL